MSLLNRNMVDWNAKCVLVMIAALVVWRAMPAHSQETRAMMRWKNGDILVGTLLEDKSGRICWSSPVFTSALVVESKALESIIFPSITEQPTEAFRIVTVMGDVLVADIVGSDEKTFQVNSKRYGRVQVDRDAVHWLNRRVRPHLIFDGSQISSWEVDLDGPVMESTYKLYAGDWIEADEDGFPIWSQLSPVEIGRMPNGYLDVDFPRFRNRFAMLFEGRIDITDAGEYYCGVSADEKARMFIDGQWVAQAEAADVAHEEFEAVIDPDNRPKVKLSSGPHSLRVEYFNNAGHTRLNAWISGADAPYRSLDGINKGPGWHGGPGGRPRSIRKQAALSKKINMPKQFEIDLELISSASPQFVVALGRDTWDATSKHLLRLETRANEVVVAQDTVFEPVMAVAKGQRSVRLRLVCEGNSDQLQVFDSSGNLLIRVKGIQMPSGDSVIYVRNRGEDLAVHRLRIYPLSKEVAGQPIDHMKSRVHLADEQVIYGHLMVTEDGACVIDQNGVRRGVDLDKVDCISGPDREWATTADTVELVYADGDIVRGRVESVYSDRVVLRTAFSGAPVTCSLNGASSLRFGSPARRTSPSRHSDRLFCALGELHGRLSFDLPGSPLSWRSEGDAPPVGLAVTGGTRIERNDRAVTKGPFFDVNMFPYLLHLQNGEIIPCRVATNDRHTLGFQTPFLKQQKIDLEHIKAIEFNPVEKRKSKRESAHAMNDWLREPLGTDPATSAAIDPTKLDHALTIPRFNRDSPPTHILVARNGDLMRGTLLDISESSVHFESKRRKQMIPIDRLAHIVCVVCMSEPEGDEGGPTINTADLTEVVRARLAHGSILIFDPLAARDGKLVGRSAIYGEMAVPVQSIQELNLGGSGQEPFHPLFKEWVVHPAQKP
jgi:hypothetical protein